VERRAMKGKRTEEVRWGVEAKREVRKSGQGDMKLHYVTFEL